MHNPRNNEDTVVAVAVDGGKRSHHALKWALDHVLPRGQTVRMVHVHQPQHISTSSDGDQGANGQDPIEAVRNLFLPFRCFCSRRGISFETVTLEDQDVCRALIDYILLNRIDTLVLGASSRNGIARLLIKNDIPSSVLRGAPSFCSIYVISKGKVVSVRAASHANPPPRPRPYAETQAIGGAAEERLPDEVSIPEVDMSFVSPGRVSTDSMLLDFYDHLGSEVAQMPRNSFDVDIPSYDHRPSSVSKFSHRDSLPHRDSSGEMSPSGEELGRKSSSANTNDLVQEKMRRLEIQMNQTMDMYHTACKEALTAKQKARDLELLQMETEKRLEAAERAKEEALARESKLQQIEAETRSEAAEGVAILRQLTILQRDTQEKLAAAERAKEEALKMAEEEREKWKAARKLAKAAEARAEMEAQKRRDAEARACKEAEDKTIMLASLGHSHVVLQYQSLLHIIVVLLVLYFFFSK